VYRSRALAAVVAMFVLSTLSGFAQTATDQTAADSMAAGPAPAPVLLPAVTLAECVAAARTAGANLKLAGITLDAARAALLQGH
jgi:hypothetical protein